MATVSSLCSCSGSSSDDSGTSDGKTYSFVVDYYDDAGIQVGYDYVPYGKPSRSVRKPAEKDAYDYKPHKSDLTITAGKRWVFSEWEGKYENVDATLPAYNNSEHPVPEIGETIDRNNIKADCSLKAEFVEEDITYTTRFYSEGSLIKDGDTAYDNNVKHAWGSFPAMPTEPSKKSNYGYQTDFLGYGFKSGGNSLKPFKSFGEFYYGYGEPDSVEQFYLTDGTSVTEVSSGSLYEDISTKGEDGYYTLDLYGYDGEWNYIGSMATLNQKVSLYANYSEPKKVDFPVEIYSSYDSKSSGAKPIATTTATFTHKMYFTEGDDYYTLTFKEEEKSQDSGTEDQGTQGQETQGSESQEESSHSTSVNIDKSEISYNKIRKWMGFYSDDDSISDLYRGKPMPDDAYVFAPLSLFPISADCTVTIVDADGNKLCDPLVIKYGTKLTIATKDTSESTSEDTSEGTSEGTSESTPEETTTETVDETSEVVTDDTTDVTTEETANAKKKIISATDSSGNETKYEYNPSSATDEDDWKLTYSDTDIGLSDELKGKTSSIKDAIMGDCTLKFVGK